MTKFLLNWLKNVKGANEVFGYAEYCGGVVEFVAVIWSRENCDESSVGKELVAVLNDLMGTSYQVESLVL